MLQGFVSINSLGRLHAKQLANQVSRVQADWLRIRVCGFEVNTFLNFLEEFLEIFSSEWKLARQRCVQDDARGPQVCLLPTVLLIGREFWKHIGGSSTLGFKLLETASCKTKVDDFGLVLTFFVHYVLELDVSMAKAILMHTF